MKNVFGVFLMGLFFIFGNQVGRKPLEATGVEAIVVAGAAATVYSSCCLPFMRWGAKKAYYGLETSLEKENREKLEVLNTQTELKEKILSVINVTGGNVMIINGSQIPSSCFQASKPLETISFETELLSIAQKQNEILNIKLFEGAHALMFNDPSHTLQMIGAVSKLNDTIFDFLIDDQSSNDSWQRDQAILHQFIGLLNQTINTSKIETDGLYISTSGHKFYKFNTTYLIPIRAQELTFPIPMIASVLDPEDYPLSVENF